jgi:flagellar biosynthesis GTPase FlhF
MRIKSFFAKSVDQAMADARAEMGEEALLLNTRRVPASEPGTGGYEVVLGVAGDGPEQHSIPAEVSKETIPGSILAATQAAKAAARVAVSVASGVSEPLFAEQRQRNTSKDSRLTPVPEAAGAVKPAVNVASSVSGNVANHAPGPLAAELLHLHRQMDEIHGLLARSSRTRVMLGRSVPEVEDIHARLLAADVEPALAQDIAGRVATPLPRNRTARIWILLQIDRIRCGPARPVPLLLVPVIPVPVVP